MKSQTRTYTIMEWKTSLISLLLPYLSLYFSGRSAQINSEDLICCSNLVACCIMQHYSIHFPLWSMLPGFCCWSDLNESLKMWTFDMEYTLYITAAILWTNNCILYFQSGRRTLHATFFKRINLEMENDRLTRFAILQFEWILVVALWWMIANYENNDTDHCVFSGFVIYSIYQPLCSVLFYLPYCIIRYRCGNISSSL